MATHHDDWDRELAAVEQEVDRHRAGQQSDRRASRECSRKRRARDRAKDGIERNLRRIESYCQTDRTTPSQNRALVHGAAALARKVRRWLEAFEDEANKRLWIRIMQNRLLGKASKENDVDGEALVDLAVRQKRLEKTARYLEEALASLAEKRNTLGQRYVELGVMKANKQASTAFSGRLGRSVSDAWQSPQMQGMSQYLWRITRPVSPASSPPDTHQVLATKTDTMIDRCRNIIIDQQTNPKAGRSPKARRRFQQGLKVLDRLEEQTLSPPPYPSEQNLSAKDHP